MLPWFTGKPCVPANRSHINLCVVDSTWEAPPAHELDHNPNVAAWVKNDHLGFEIVYIFKGIVRKYRPDFIIRLTNGTHLVLEIKGEANDESKAKRAFLDEWIEAVNAQGGFGYWKADVAYAVSDVPQKIADA